MQFLVFSLHALWAMTFFTQAQDITVGGAGPVNLGGGAPVGINVGGGGGGAGPVVNAPPAVGSSPGDATNVGGGSSVGGGTNPGSGNVGGASGGITVDNGRGPLITGTRPGQTGVPDPKPTTQRPNNLGNFGSNFPDFNSFGSFGDFGNDFPSNGLLGFQPNNQGNNGNGGGSGNFPGGNTGRPGNFPGPFNFGFGPNSGFEFPRDFNNGNSFNNNGNSFNNNGNSFNNNNNNNNDNSANNDNNDNEASTGAGNNPNNLLDLDTLRFPPYFNENNNGRFNRNDCVAPTNVKLPYGVDNSSIPDAVAQMIQQEAIQRRELMAVIEFFDSTQGQLEEMPPESNTGYSCPADYSYLTKFTTQQNIDCWVLPPPTQDPIVFASCRCTRCRESAAGRYSPSNECKPVLTPRTVIAYCPLAQSAQTAPMRIQIPTSCKCSIGENVGRALPLK